MSGNPTKEIEALALLLRSGSICNIYYHYWLLSALG
uniref:Uncharacterized protein n=1 Tax=Rhizophora mucronata TaxID=61149 RepID=A0A2P2PVV5_RHIMU